MHKDLPVINRADLLKNLQSLLPHIEKDILAYSESNAELNEHLQSEYRAAVEAERTAEHFVSWREAQITQAAVAWVLTCVFVRFLEDNGLLTEPVLAGPVHDAQGRNALQQAKERMVAYFNENPTFEERHYLLDLFAELEKYPVIAELLDHRHNPLWQIPVSADGAKRLIDFFQKIDADSGEILHDFTDQEWDTRFLGDLYQDLSESVRKRYALLQTPEFVESFILDYTLEPAIQTFGLPGLRLIDPTCGSGHFLLTTFERVFNQWLKREPGTNARELAQRALDVVHGTDINPYAIAICRFRLLIAAMKAAGSSKIKDAPSFHFNLACGDSLLHGRRFEWQGQGIQQGLLDEESKHVYEVEDSDRLNKILGQRYHVVVGNPPYITVKDKALNQAYRDKYLTCYRQYSLGVPFTERFFDLTLYPQGNQPAGFMGMITANSFMKREFGKKLIEEYLTLKDLTHVIDSSGAFIPGHGTPTVILFARNQSPISNVLRAVLGVRGEPTTPLDPAQGFVWSSIVSFLPRAGSENKFVSVVDQSRDLFSSHPWSVGGGGASDLKQIVESNSNLTLQDCIHEIGFGAVTREDDAYLVGGKVALRAGVPSSQILPIVEGEVIRDWRIDSPISGLWPYDENTYQAVCSPGLNRILWPLKTQLSGRVAYGLTQLERGLKWYEYSMFFSRRFEVPLSLTFAFVASHNHFVLDRGGKVFKQSSPLVKLAPGSSVEDHLVLLGVLNSSTACFWMKQVGQQKQLTGGDGVRVESRAKVPYEFPGTALKKLPLPSAFGELSFRESIVDLVSRADKISEEIDLLSADKVLARAIIQDAPLNSAWDEALALRAKLRSQLILIQEELDWRMYFFYGLCEESLLADISSWLDVPVEAGQRPFEILSGTSDEGFEVPTDVPAGWPVTMQEKWRERIEAIRQDQWLRVIEEPHYKRRWIGRQGLFNHAAKFDELKDACREWLLDKFEEACKVPALQTCAQLADRLRNDSDLVRIAELYSNGSILDMQALVAELVDSDNVPQMAAARLKITAMGKFYAWHEIWEKQRLEDSIDAKYGVDRSLSNEEAQDPEKKAKYDFALAQAKLEKTERVGDIPLPPQYKATDFRKPSYWPLRGKLDVPKERFFSLPGCEKGGDSTLVIGWAGLNHLQRAQAIAAWYLDRKESEGWEAERLMPMLSALDELIPWLKQWHNEVDPEFGERMGDYYEGFLLEELRNLEITRTDLLSWQPAAVAGKRSGRKKKVAEQN
ncbi:BREX-2 system adenine-specific DNA-methyltransferase PglX [Stutzerimonas kunmingensis]|uniref:BREX-2 system adenine-specific DNA-methyltransferase PglX n=1 Tax=Stutzerimonas kunmingensis TaxID=1211807 RepID=UPI0035CFCC49